MLFLLVLCAGCATAPAQLPPKGLHGSACERWHLTYEGNGWQQERWKRADGRYGGPQIRPVIAEQPQANKLLSRVYTRHFIAGALMGAGTGLVAGAVILVSVEPSAADAGLVGAGIGAAAVFTGAVLFLTGAKFSDVAELYNKELCAQSSTATRVP